MSSVLDRGRVTAGQDVLERTINQLKMLGTPPLGPEFKSLRGTYLNDSLVIHRLSSKFERPNGKRDDLKVASIQKMLEYDKRYAEVQKNLFKAKGVVTHFYSARAWMHDTLRNYRPSYKVEFPSGESVVSNKGFVDFYYKLTTDSQWTVSQGCVKQATKIAYNNRCLKRVVIDRYKSKYKGLLDKRKIWVKEALDKGVFIGFYVFQRMFLYCVDIVGVSRLTTVPKNNKEDRVISCDPVWNLVVQRSIALGLLDCVKKTWGIDIHKLQQIHHMRIAYRGDATIDFSKASDSNWLQIFKLLFPVKVVNDVLSARTGLVEYEGEYYVLNQLAPMGCGFTFEIMTLTLMAFARVLDSSASVFGDDVIINQHSAPRFIKTMENLGWVVNEDKSFVDGYFSESCGGFYNHHLQEYIVSHDLFFPETIADVIAATNKLSNILRANQVGRQVRQILLVAYTSLLCILPSVAFTWDKLMDGEEAERVWVPKSIPLESFRRRSEPEYSADYHKDSSYGKRLIFRTDVDIPERRDDVKGVLYATYMYAGIRAIGPRSGNLVWVSYQR